MKFLNKFFNFLIVGGLIVIGAFFYLNKNRIFNQPEPQLAQLDQSSVDVDKVVNKYLQQTNDQMLKDRIDSNRAVNKALKEPLKLNIAKPVSPAEIPLDQQIHKEPKQPEMTASEEARARLNQQIEQQRLEKIEKQEYARQFIENARKGGYQIELSEDLEVIKVTPIRKPSQAIDSYEILPSN